MSIPTGFPSMVQAEPMFMAMTAMTTKGTGFRFRVSQTWKIRAEMKTMEVVSSAMQDRAAPMAQARQTNILAVMPGMGMTVMIIQLKRPRAFSTTMIIIMATRKRIMSSFDSSTRPSRFVMPPRTRMEMPTKAMGRWCSQKNSAVEMTRMNTVAARV